MNLTSWTKLIKRTFLTVVSVLLLTVTNNAATLTVIDPADSGPGTLRQAISSAASGDTIVFNLPGCPCVISLASALSINRNLTISGPGATQLTVNGNNLVRVFQIQGVAPPSVTISGLTIANGTTAANGGGIFLQSGTLTVSGSTITNNTAPTSSATTGFGGGIMADSGTNLSVINSIVVNNSCVRGGGGISTGIPAATTNLTISGSTISGNTSGFGGGVYTTASSLITTLNTNFTNNTATANGFGGGGLYNSGSGFIRGGTINLNDATGSASGGGGIFNNGNLNLLNVNISNNTAPTNSEGGGIYNVNVLSITNSTISANQSSGGGGGISNSTLSTNSGTLTISSSTISGNTTSASGGGINNDGTSLNITNSTVSGNQAQGVSAFGGGINNAPTSTTSMTNCTIAFNSSVFRGGGVSNEAANTSFTVRNTIIAQGTAPNRGPDAIGAFLSQGFNLIGNDRDNTGFTNGANNDIVGNSGAPIDPLLAALGNNGGATPTHALQSMSPAIDTGNSGFSIVTDQRGNARFFDAPAAANSVGGNFSDIGAFEALSPTAASVHVGGRILTLAGSGLANAIVIMTDSSGNARMVRSGAFGYYRFDEVVVGDIYIIQVISKRYLFAPQVVLVTDEVTELNFTTKV